MQPIFSISASGGGLLHINGRFWGEISAERPAIVPAAPFGALYLQFYPFCGDVMTRRVTLSKGALVPQNLSGQQGVFAVIWPGGLIELELHPNQREDAPCASPEEICFAWEDVRGTLSAEGALELWRGGHRARCRLPRGAKKPYFARRAQGLLLSGDVSGGGRYALLLSEDLTRCLLDVCGRELLFMENGGVRVLRDLADTVGHARLETWMGSASNEREPYALCAAEPLWSPGAPIWPQSPEQAALAFAEAVLLGQWDEARGYLTAECEQRHPNLAEEFSAWEGCAALKYASCAGCSAIGLTRALAENCLLVAPLEYRAVPSGGMQGLYRLERLDVRAPG